MQLSLFPTSVLPQSEKIQSNYFFEKMMKQQLRQYRTHNTTKLGKKLDEVSQVRTKVNVE